MNTPRFLAISVLVLLSGVAGGREPEPADEFVPVDVRALRDVVVAAEVAGAVVKRPADESAPVQEGEVVVTLDGALPDAVMRAARATLEEAEAHREWAELEFGRVEKLLAKESVGRADYDKVVADMRRARALAAVAKARAAEAETRWQKTQIRAPFAGRLVRVYPEVGSYLQPGRPAFRLIDDAQLKLVAFVPARLLFRLNKGTEVRIVADGTCGPLPELAGRVHLVGAAAEGKARTFRIEVRLEDKSGRWRPGMTGRLRVPEGSLR